MFDMQSEFAFKMRTESAGHVDVAVAWPTDQQFLERQRSTAIVVANLGRGNKTTEVKGGDEANLALYNQIRTSDSPDLTPMEATYFMDLVTKSEVVDGEEIPEGYALKMMTSAGEVSHKVKIPSTQQVMTYRRAAFRILDRPFGKQEVKVNIQAASDLYDACAVGNEGYANGVPVVHKDLVVKGLLEFIESETAGDPN